MARNTSSKSKSNNGNRRMSRSATAVATLAWAIREQERIRAENEQAAAAGMGECPDCHGDGDTLAWNADALSYEVTPCAACRGKGRRILTDAEQRAMLLRIDTRGDN